MANTLTAEEAKWIAGSLPKGCRDLLVAHVDGRSAVDARMDVRDSHGVTRDALIERKLIRPIYENGRGSRPSATRITDAGRMVLGCVLADYAEALLRAQWGIELTGRPAVKRAVRNLTMAVQGFGSVEVPATVPAHRRLLSPGTELVHESAKSL